MSVPIFILVPAFLSPGWKVGHFSQHFVGVLFCWVFGLWFILLIAPLRGCGCESSTESLILAQDERWRRA